MASTYVNDLRLNEMATGDASGTWGTITNTNLELIGEALGYGTQDCFTSDADATTTVADGATDPARAMYFKVTSSATLTTTRTLTIAPNTVSRLQFIENATLGGQSINISQGSGANVTIGSGETKAVYLDGAGSGAAVVDSFATFSVANARFADGSNSAPSISFTSDTNTGIYRGGTDILKFVTAGTDAITIDASQNTTFAGAIAVAGASGAEITITDNSPSTVSLFMGAGNSSVSIGSTTSDPVTFLSANTKRMQIESNGDISFYEDTGTTPKFFWDASAERLGIGHSAPATEIDVRQTNTGADTGIRVYNLDNSNTTTQTASLFLSPDSRGNGALVFGEKENADFSTSAGRDVSLVFSPVLNNTQTRAMTILSSGNVGIATDSPNAKLTSATTDGGNAFSIHRDFSGDVGGAETGTGSFNFTLTDTATSDQIVSRINSVAVAGTGDAFAGSMRFFTAVDSGSLEERMRITSTNVGINTSSPTSGYMLHVGGSSGVHTKVKIEATTATGQAELDLSADPAGVSYLNLGDEDSYNIGYLGYFHSDNSMRFQTNSAVAMHIDSSGNVGIGGSPNNWGGMNRTLELIGSSDVQLAIHANSDSLSNEGRIGEVAFLAGTTNTLPNVATIVGRVAGTDEAKGFLTFHCRDTDTAGLPQERMRINQLGNVGIGSTSPTSAKLQIENNSAGTQERCIYANQGQTSGTSANNVAMFSASNSAFSGDLVRIHHESPNSNQIMFKTTTTGSNTVGFAIDSAGLTNIYDHTASANNQALSVQSNCTSRSGLQVTAQNASYGNSNYGVIRLETVRSSSSSFQYAIMRSGDGADIQFQMRGDGNAYADNNWNSGGADYAEYFEWKDGNSSSEDRRGYTVVLDGNQIRKSTSDDAQSSILGVVSATPAMVGDSGQLGWQGKHERDEWGSYILEEYTQTEWTDADGELKSYQTDKIPSNVTVPDDALVTSTGADGKTKLMRRKESSSYDASQTYTPREDRKEWDTIGLIGKLRIRVGQTVGDRWIKMREISDTVHEYLVR